MSLTTCRECGREVSTEAPSCPHCGAPGPSGGWAGYPRRTWGFEWRSETEVLGWPLVHVAVGRDPQGRIRVAKGIIAIGQFAVGLITVAQFGVGVVFGFGQFIVGCTAIAQVAVTAYFALGQLALGHVAIGQVAVGNYALGQLAFGRHLWTPTHKDPEAVAFFRGWWETFALWRQLTEKP